MIDYQAVATNFRSFVKEIQNTKPPSAACIEAFSNNYDVEDMNLDSFSIQEAVKSHEDILSKYQSRQLKKVWCESENKLFMWMVVYWELVSKKKAHTFDDGDWMTLTLSLPRKTIQDVKFQFKMLSKLQQTEHWQQEQLKLLDDIIRQQKLENKWNEVSKQLFKISDQKYFRRPKQCREQWKNHLDPDIEKGEWTVDNDYQLLELVLDVGKKWSSIAKCIGKRTEHSVKNRYHSLIKQYTKLSKKNNKIKSTGKRKDQEEELINYIMKCMKEADPTEEQELKPAPKKKKPVTKSEKPVEIKKQIPAEEPKPVFQNPAPVPQNNLNNLKDFFGARDEIGDRIGYVYSPLTPYTTYIEKNKHLGNLLLVTSPRIISPRFKMINQWEDLDNKEYFL